MIGSRETRSRDELGVKPMTNDVNENCNSKSWIGRVGMWGIIEEKVDPQYHMEYCIVWKIWIAAGKVMTIKKLDCSSVAARFSEYLQDATEELRASIPCRWEYSKTHEWYQVVYLSCRKDRTCDWCAIKPKYGSARICSEDDMAGSILSQCYLLMQEDDIALMRHASCLHRPLHCRRIRMLVAIACQSAAQSNTDLSQTQSVTACMSICL